MKNQIPAILINIFAAIGMIFAVSTLISSSIKDIKTNTQAIIETREIVKDNTKRLNENDVKSARVETKLDYIIKILEDK